MKNVLILGANSDVAKQVMVLYLKMGYTVMAASRSLDQIEEFVNDNHLDKVRIHLLMFDSVDFSSHQSFYSNLPHRPHIVLYAAGYLVGNQEAIHDWERTFQMINVHYSGAVSILNIIASDKSNDNLERIIGLSSLSGVRGRKSNFIYGSSKAAFTQYLAGLRQLLFDRGVIVNVVVAGYIRSKMVAGLSLPERLLLEPAYIAREVVSVGRKFQIVPNWKWKGIYWVLRLLPEHLVAKLP